MNSDIVEKIKKEIIQKEVVLSSGKKSSFYIDIKSFCSCPENLLSVGSAIYEKIRKEKVDVVCGIAYGGVPIAVMVSILSFLDNRKIPMITVRSEKKRHGKQEIIEGKYEKGNRVIIIDDVVTTGASIRKAVDIIENEGLVFCGAVVVVDRRNTAKIKDVSFFKKISKEQLF